MWAGALGGVYTLPANGTQIAAANFDLSGTTKLGTKLIDHSFFIPMLVLSVTTIAVGARHRRGLLLSPATTITESRPNGATDADAADRGEGSRPDAGPDRGSRAARLDPFGAPSPATRPSPSWRWPSRRWQMFRDVGFTNAQLMDVPTGYPPIYGEIPGPEGSPVVMLYGHYDVQPAPPEQGWTTDPWTPTTKDDGRIYGRGAADDKGGLAIHLGTLQIFEGKPPCTIRLIVEGMEETASNLEPFVDAHPDLFDCDLFIVCDMGNLRVGEPVLTTALRGDVACIVTLRTLEHPLHSGLFGGAAPDAMMALARLLSSLVDDDGTVAVPGVTSGEWDGAEFTPEDLRSSADLLEGSQHRGRRSRRIAALGQALDQRDRDRHDQHRRIIERPGP